MNTRQKNSNEATIIFWTLSLTMCFLSCSTRNTHPYVSLQELTSPIYFQKEIITTENGICFSNDGKTLYLSQSINKKFDNGKNFLSLFSSTYQNGKWSAPKQIYNNIDAYHPVLSFDNKKLFFNSRSHRDTIHHSIPHNIWLMTKKKDVWSKAELVANVNSADYDSYPSLAKNNNLYFNSSRAGGKGGMDIYFSKFEKGNYLPPINIKTINSADEENDLVIDPAERFIIFNRYKHTTKSIDLFVSYNENNQWSIPKAIDVINSDSLWELTPTLSPDGKYFFYEVNNKMMQIELNSIINLQK